MNSKILSRMWFIRAKRYGVTLVEDATSTQGVSGLSLTNRALVVEILNNYANSTQNYVRSTLKNAQLNAFTAKLYKKIAVNFFFKFSTLVTAYFTQFW